MKNKKETRKKHFNKKRVFLLLLFTICIFYIVKNPPTFMINKLFSSSRYPIIKQDQNENYDGLGQQKVSKQDGYFTTFTTAEKQKKTYKEFKQNGSSSWSQHAYWDATMSESGCGITSMSIILSGYDKKETPETLRKKYYPVLDGSKISQELSSTFGLKNSDFYYDSTHLSKASMEKHLKTNRPILVCVWNKPEENRWTSASHYMVLLACDGKGKVYISNPNGLENDSKSSGWYNFSELTPYLAKALYIESY